MNINQMVMSVFIYDFEGDQFDSPLFRVKFIYLRHPQHGNESITKYLWDIEDALRCLKRVRDAQ